MHSLLMTIAGLAMLSGAASAQTLIDATDPARIADIGRGFGAVEVTTDAVGDPMLRGRMNGTRYVVFFYGCDNGRNCTNIQFSAAWENTGAASERALRDWNTENRFGKAVLDAENDPVIKWDVNLFGGVSRTNLDDTFDWWRIVLERFERFLE